MEPVSRRSLIGAAAGAFAGGVFSGDPTTRASTSDEKQKSAPPASPPGTSDSIYKYRMGEAHARRYGESTVREHKLDDFPISTSMSATLITLAPGDVREPHWHPNSDEWLFVMEGVVRMTIVDAAGKASQFDCEREDVAFTPQGFGHYVESVGKVPAKLMLVHNHANFTTIHLSEWVAGGSIPVFASTLNMPVSAFDNVPAKKVFISPNKPK